MTLAAEPAPRRDTAFTPVDDAGFRLVQEGQVVVLPVSLVR